MVRSSRERGVFVEHTECLHRGVCRYKSSPMEGGMGAQSAPIGVWVKCAKCPPYLFLNDRELIRARGMTKGGNDLLEPIKSHRLLAHDIHVAIL